MVYGKAQPQDTQCVRFGLRVLACVDSRVGATALSE